MTVYTASYDEEGKTLTIEGESTAKSDHDFLYLTLKEDGAKSVTLEIKIEIHTGAHLIARALGAVFAKPCRRSCAGTFITTLRRCARGKKRSGCRRPNWTVLRKRFLKRSNPKKTGRLSNEGLPVFYSFTPSGFSSSIFAATNVSAVRAAGHREGKRRSQGAASPPPSTRRPPPYPPPAPAAGSSSP